MAATSGASSPAPTALASSRGRGTGSGARHASSRSSPTPAEASSLYDSWAIASPGKPLFQAASANFALHATTTVDLHNSHRGPLLITQGGKDHTVPPAITKATYKLHHRKSSAKTDLQEFPEADHSLTVDSDWRQIADAVLTWLKAQGR